MTRAERSERMSRVRSKDTGPELVVRRLIHGMGFRYRLHVHDLPGHPDMVFPRRGKIIFVRGYFWHRHGKCKNTRWPKSKLNFWKPKLEGNRARDATVMQNATSMDTPALVDLIISLVDELIRRDKTEPIHLYVVGGVHSDDAPQITADYVAATGEEQATQRVEGIRRLSSDGWTHDLSYLHLEDIRNALVALQIPSLHI